MAGELSADRFVPARFVGHQVTFTADVHADDRQQGSERGPVNVPATCAAATGDDA